MKIIVVLIVTLTICLLPRKIATTKLIAEKSEATQAQNQLKSKFIRLGQKYLCVNTASYPCHDAVTGELLPVTRLLFQVLTLRQIQTLPDGKRNLLMQMTSYPHDLVIPVDKVLTTGAHATPEDHDDPYFNGFFPIVEDKKLETLRKRFEDKLVWSFGGGSNSFIQPEYSTYNQYYANGSSFKIKRIYHVLAPFPLAEMFNTCGGITAAYLDAFSRDPLVVILDNADEKFINTNPYAKNSTSKIDVHPIGYFRFCADNDDFHRVFTTQSPYTTHLEWPHRMRKAVMAGRLIKGMTREMVAWSVGWPFASDTIPKMKKKDEWVYDTTPHNTFTVQFRKGKLVRWFHD